MAAQYHSTTYIILKTMSSGNEDDPFLQVQALVFSTSDAPNVVLIFV